MTEPPSVVTLRVDLKVRDYDMLRQAFEGDAGGRADNGARRYRIFRPIEAASEVSLDLDFDSADSAEAFLEVPPSRLETPSSPAEPPTSSSPPGTGSTSTTQRRSSRVPRADRRPGAVLARLRPAPGGLGNLPQSE